MSFRRTYPALFCHACTFASKIDAHVLMTFDDLRMTSCYCHDCYLCCVDVKHVPDCVCGHVHLKTIRCVDVVRVYQLTDVSSPMSVRIASSFTVTSVTTTKTCTIPFFGRSPASTSNLSILIMNIPSVSMSVMVLIAIGFAGQ